MSICPSVCNWPDVARPVDVLVVGLVDDFFEGATIRIGRNFQAEMFDAVTVWKYQKEVFLPGSASDTGGITPDECVNLITLLQKKFGLFIKATYSSHKGDNGQYLL